MSREEGRVNVWKRDQKKGETTKGKCWIMERK